MTRPQLTVLLPLFVALIVFMLLLPNLPPGITFVDSGQLCTAAWGLGIAHPPGYPLWCLWVHLGMGVSGNLDPAVWGAIASALMLAIAGGLWTRVGMTLAKQAGWEEGWQTFAGLVVGLAAVSSRIVLARGVEAEVYTLNLAFSALLILLTLTEKPDMRRLVLFTFLAGLGLSNHNSLVLVIIPCFITLFLRLAKDKSNRLWSRLPLLAVFFLLGFSIWLYLPLRSSTSPIISWGWPDSLDRFWVQFTRSAYGGMQLKRLAFLDLYFGRMLSSVPLEMGYPLCAAVLLGLISLWRNRHFWLIVALFILTGPFACTMLTIMLQPHQSVEMLIWLAPWFMLCGFLAAWGLVFWARKLWQLLHRQNWLAFAAGAVIMVIIGITGAINLTAVSYTNYWLAEDYGHNILTTLPYRAVYVLELRGSLGAFETAYQVKVRGLRPDFRIADTTATIFTNRSEYRNFHSLPPEQQRRKAWDTEIRALKSDLPCLYNYESSIPASLGMSMGKEGMLFIALPKGEHKRDSLAVFAAYRTRRLDEDWADDEWANQSKVQYHLFHAQALWQAGRQQEAKEEFSVAGTAAAGWSPQLGKVAESMMEVGDWEAAARYFTEALDVMAPERAGSTEFRYDVGGMWFNLALARGRSGDRAGAEKAFAMVERICPELLLQMRTQ